GPEAISSSPARKVKSLCQQRVPLFAARWDCCGILHGAEGQNGRGIKHAPFRAPLREARNWWSHANRFTTTYTSKRAGSILPWGSAMAPVTTPKARITRRITLSSRHYVHAV